MYRVMIIDDEKAIRSLLRITIDWNELGMKVVGEAASGIEAINTIDELNPDIAFVDIRMPFMDGIEFSKLAIKRYPQLKIIVLTAFNEFEYARQCIGIGICEYLLKPIVRKEIKKVLQKIKEQLDAEEPEECDEEIPVSGLSSIDKIKDYLHYNYFDPNLNLTKVALKFGFNASYLSRAFKNETGKSFINYLTECRMEKAVQLAGKGKLMCQAAEEVGIPDPNYFSKCFKKNTGKNYSELRKKN